MSVRAMLLERLGAAERLAPGTQHAQCCSPAPCRRFREQRDGADARVPGRQWDWPATTSGGFQLSVLDSLFGGSLSSRLFQEVREKRGWSTACTPSPASIRRPGLAGIYFGCRPERLEAVVETVGRELVRLVKEPVPADELQRAKEHLKGRMILGLESTSSRMTRLGKRGHHRYRDTVP